MDWQISSNNVVNSVVIAISGVIRDGLGLTDLFKQCRQQCDDCYQWCDKRWSWIDRSLQTILSTV